MSTTQRTTRTGGKNRSETRAGVEPVTIERLLDLEPYTDDIIGQINADRQLALLAVADPVGVMRDLGYELSRGAAREMRRVMPRLTGERRDRYLAWLRGLDPIPDTVDIKLIPRARGRELLTRSAPAQKPAGSRGVAGTTGDAAFDVVIQLSEALAERMLQRHYADARLPRSVYRIGGKLYHFVHSGHYEDFRHAVGTADREIHFAKPSLEFSKTKRVRITSSFLATGFGKQSISGTTAVDGTLVLRKDSHGYPHFVEVTFDALKTTDVTTSFSTPAGASPPSKSARAEVTKTILNAYKGFHTAFSSTKPYVPLTVPLVDGSELAACGAPTRKVTATFDVVTPTGAAEPLLVVGLNRAGRTTGGTLNSIPSYIKPGGDLALVQDANWLEEGLDAGFADALPIRFDASTGYRNDKGGLRVDSIDWHYRAGGLTGDLSGMQDDVVLWWDHSVTGQVHIDVSFHSSQPTLSVTGSSDLEGMECWEKILFTIVLVVLAAVAGAAIGAVIGALAGGAVVLGAAIGGVAGAGIATTLAFVKWPITFDGSGTPTTGSSKQTLKLTHEQALPAMSATATVVPNGFEIDGSGTRMSAKVVGPTYEVAEPWVRIAGSHAVDIEPLPDESPSSPSAAAAGSDEGDVMPSATTPSTSIGASAGSLSGVAISPANSGTISLHYHLASTYGLQGTLKYAWTFSGQPIGAYKGVNLDVPVPTDVVRMLEFNKVNILGVLKLTATDAFGRSASDSVTITVGNAKDLRAYRPRIIPDRFAGPDPDPFGDPFVDPLGDPLGKMRTKWQEELAAHVGWPGEDGDPMASDGVLVGYTEFASPLSGQPVAVVATASAHAVGAETSSSRLAEMYDM